MESAIPGMLGGLAAMALLFSTVGCAFIVTERLIPQSSSAIRWCGIGVVGTWILVTLFMALAPLGAFRLGPCLTILPGLCAVTWLLIGRKIAVHSILRADAEALMRAGRMIRTSRWLPLYSATAGLLILVAARVILIPPLDQDALTYHLFIAGQYVQAGGYCFLQAPDAWQYYSYFPANGEVLSAWLMLPFHGDLLAQWGNLGYWLMIAVGFYALARTFGVTSETAMLGSLVISVMPTLFSFIPTSHVELRALALCLAGTLFFTRWMTREGGGHLILAFCAFGVAVGIKLIALPVLGGALVFVIGRILAVQRGSSLRSTTGWLAAAIACAFVVSAPWYARAWHDQGSWTYPFRLIIGDRELTQGSPQLSRMLQARYDHQCSVWSSRCEAELQGTPADPVRRLLVQVRQSVMSPWVTMFLPDNLTMGPVGILLVVALPWSLVAAWRRGPRWPLAFTFLAWAGCLAAHYSKEGRLFIWIWPTISARMLIFPTALMLLWTLVLVEGAGRVSRLLWTSILILTAAGLVYSIPVRYSPEELAQILNVAFLLVVGVLTAWGIGHNLPWNRAVVRCLAAVAAPVLFVLMTPFLAIGRDHFRNDFLAGSSEIFNRPHYLAPAWAQCDTPVRPRRIAFTAGWDGTGHNWIWYPLLGRRLQNHVTYIPISADGRIIDYQLADQVRAEASYTAWLDRLTEQRIDTLVCSPPATVEQRWADEHPDIFRRVQAGKVSIYEISLEESARLRQANAS